MKLENSFAISSSVIASERDTLTWSGDLLTHGFVTFDFKAGCHLPRPGGL